MSWTSTRNNNRSPRAGTEGSRDVALVVKRFYVVLFLLMTSFCSPSALNVWADALVQRLEYGMFVILIQLYSEFWNNLYHNISYCIMYYANDRIA